MHYSGDIVREFRDAVPHSACEMLPTFLYELLQRLHANLNGSPLASTNTRLPNSWANSMSVLQRSGGTPFRKAPGKNHRWLLRWHRSKDSSRFPRTAEVPGWLCVGPAPECPSRLPRLRQSPDSPACSHL